MKRIRVQFYLRKKDTYQGLRQQILDAAQTTPIEDIFPMSRRTPHIMEFPFDEDRYDRLKAIVRQRFIRVELTDPS